MVCNLKKLSVSNTFYQGPLSIFLSFSHTHILIQEVNQPSLDQVALDNNNEWNSFRSVYLFELEWRHKKNVYFDFTSICEEINLL